MALVGARYGFPVMLCACGKDDDIGFLFLEQVSVNPPVESDRGTVLLALGFGIVYVPDEFVVSPRAVGCGSHLAPCVVALLVDRHVVALCGSDEGSREPSGSGAHDDDLLSLPRLLESIETPFGLTRRCRV